MHIQGGIFMEYTKLGNSDLNVSRICMGCMGFGNAKSGMHSWTVDEEHSREILKRGLERGVTSFDTAAGYQCGGDRERSQRKRAYFRAAGPESYESLHGSSQKQIILRIRTAGPNLFRFRDITICYSARRNARWFRSARIRILH